MMTVKKGTMGPFFTFQYLPTYSATLVAEDMRTKKKEFGRREKKKKKRVSQGPDPSSSQSASSPQGLKHGPAGLSSSTRVSPTGLHAGDKRCFCFANPGGTTTLLF